MAEARGELDAEDAKLLTLARSTRARARAAEGAAVRDDIGRTYAAATVTLPSLQLTALQAAVAAALSSGADHLEAVLVLGDADTLSDADTAVVHDLSPVTVLLADADGTVTAVE
ncbi:MAG: cytidine deaminase [Actinomycetes bacterium]